MDALEALREGLTRSPMEALAQQPMRKVMSDMNLALMDLASTAARSSPTAPRQPRESPSDLRARLSLAHQPEGASIEEEDFDEEAEDERPAGAEGDGDEPGISGGGESRGGVSDGSRERKKGVPWTESEHRLFLLGLSKLGKGNWRGIARQFVQTRTPTQVASHAQKYFIRQQNASTRKVRRRRPSFFDVAEFDERMRQQAAAAAQQQHAAMAVATAAALPHGPSYFDAMANVGGMRKVLSTGNLGTLGTLGMLESALPRGLDLGRMGGPSHDDSASRGMPSRPLFGPPSAWASWAAGLPPFPLGPPAASLLAHAPVGSGAAAATTPGGQPGGPSKVYRPVPMRPKPPPALVPADGFSSAVRPPSFSGLAALQDMETDLTAPPRDGAPARPLTAALRNPSAFHHAVTDAPVAIPTPVA